MIQVLYLTPGGSQWWRRDGKRWYPDTGSRERDRVWVVTDLAEESLAESKIPRLFGRDRAAMVQRQLNGRYPDSPFRGSFPNSGADGVLGTLAPTRYVFFGIDSAERLNHELDEIRNPLVGVWPISMLIGALAAHRSLPPDLFAVLPGPESLRIVFLKNRVPILTRLTLTPDRPQAQVDEIVRTIRHLENTQAIPRDRKAFPLFFLGDTGGIEPLLAAARLFLVEPYRRDTNQILDWRHALFDLAVRSPKGQIAPVARRVTYLSERVKRLARNLSILTIFAGIFAASNNLFAIYRMLEQHATITEKIENLDQEIDLLNAQIGRYGVSPDTVRKAVTLALAELDTVPQLEPHLKLLARGLAIDANLRMREFQWRLVPIGTEACPTAATVAAVSGTGEPQAGSDLRRIEISFELGIPESYGPRDRALVLRSISAYLEGLEGAKVWQDANKEYARGSLRGGSIVSGATKLAWCFALPGVIPVAEGEEMGSRT
jgi:hypothetical protein